MEIKEQILRSKETSRICNCKKILDIEDSKSSLDSNYWFNPVSVLKLESEYLKALSEKEKRMILLSLAICIPLLSSRRNYQSLSENCSSYSSG